MKNVPVKVDPIRAQLFVEHLMMRLSPANAARAAGFEENITTVVKVLMADPDVQSMIEGYKEELRDRYDTSQEKVMRDLVDAKEIAKTQGDVRSMVMALRTTIEVMGYKAPTKVEVTTSVRTDPRLRQRLRSLPEAQLIELAGESGLEVVDLVPTTVEGKVTYSPPEEPS